MKAASDEELIEKIKVGDTVAFKSIVSRYEGRVARVVLSIIGAGPIAEDIGQEVFVRFYDSVNKFRSDLSVDTFLIRQAIELSIAECKKNKRSAIRTITPEIAKDKSKHPELLDISERIHRGFLDLDPELQSIVTLRLVADYSIEVMAEILRIPERSVLNKLIQAQHKLRMGLYR